MPNEPPLTEEGEAGEGGGRTNCINVHALMNCLLKDTSYILPTWISLCNKFTLSLLILYEYIRQR